MIKNKIYQYKRSNRGLNQLLRLYERNYLKLIHFFPIGDHESSIVYLMPEGLLNKEIRISCKKLSSHTSVIEIYKSKSLSLLENTEIISYLDFTFSLNSFKAERSLAINVGGVNSGNSNTSNFSG